MAQEAELGSVVSLADAYENLFTGHGTGADASTHGKFKRTGNIEHNYEQLSLMYRDSQWAQKVIDTIPDEMTREWFKLNGVITPDDIEKVKDVFSELNITEKFNMAQKKANQMGNAYLLLDIDDGQDASLPLNLNTCKKGCINGVVLLDRSTLFGYQPDLDAWSKNFSNYKYYTLANPTTEEDKALESRIHYSRVLVFKGKKTNGYDRKLSNYYDYSLLAPLAGDILRLEAAEASLSGYIVNGNVDVFKLDGFTENMQDDEDKGFTIKHTQTMLNTKSQHNAVVIDKNDEYENLDKNTKDANDLYESLIQSLASKSGGIPKAIFLGDSESGMNSTGEGTLKKYYDNIKGKQVTEFSPHVKVLLELVSLHLGKPELDLSFEWVSLFQLDAKTQADVNKTKVETFMLLLESDTVEAHHVLTEVVQDKIMTNIDEEYILQHKEAFDELNLEDKVVDKEIDDEYNIKAEEEDKEE